MVKTKRNDKRKENGIVMWESSLYAINMFYCHWLIKKLLLADGLTEYNQAGKDIERK